MTVPPSPPDPANAPELDALDVVVVGGCGHVGLPLAVALASRGSRVGIYDIDGDAVDRVNKGEVLFREDGLEELLHPALRDGMLSASTEPATISRASMVIVVVGTPVDEHLNPNPHEVARTIEGVIEHYRDGQLVVLASTVYPGVTRDVERLFARHGLEVDVACCPERIAEGRAMTELFALPQIVSGRTPEALARAAQLFSSLTSQIVELSPEEAELAKLFTNAWRYLRFAAANQFYVMANDHGLDFERIRQALVHDYPRAADLPGAGFAAGPCLLKDTMQLAAFADNSFLLGHSAMLANEGLPLYLVTRLESRLDLAESVVGLLGMAYKGDSDDTRSSLSYKLKRILEFRAAEVLCSDPHVTTDPQLRPLEETVARSDILVIAAPHESYRDLRRLAPDKEIVDIWNLLGEGTTA
jgi:UDP-N-acetyl-D-mannosaminuronic acid dehydrogenase